MDVKLDTADMREIISEALLRAIDEKKRDELILAALRYLTTPQKPYGNGPMREAPLAEVFQYAVRNLAQECATKMLSDNETFKTALNGMITEALLRVTTDRREQLVSKISSLICDS